MKISWLKKFKQVPGPIYPVILYVCLISLVGPWWAVDSFSVDEGLNLMKAALFSDGYSLYGAIWSDQPPLLTVVLSFIHFLSDGSVATARGVILLFAGLLIWSLFRVVARNDGTGAAWFAVLVLCSTALFQKLSVSVMIGLPAIALAMVAIDQASIGAKNDQSWRFVLAGIIFALSLHTKLFTALILPSFVLTSLCTVTTGRQTDTRFKISTILKLLVPMMIVFCGVLLIIDPKFIGQLIFPHMAAREIGISRGGPDYFIHMMRKVVGIMPAILGLFGLIVSFRGAMLSRAIPLVWFLCAMGVFAFHRPLFYHHMLMIIVPLAWMSGSIFSDWKPFIFRKWVTQEKIKVVLMSLALLVVAKTAISSLSSSASKFSRPAKPNAIEAQQSLTRFSHLTNWVFSDMPMDVYRAGLMTPPPIAVFSGKRMRTGNITRSEMISVIETYQPEQISLRRFNYDQEFINYLNREYHLINHSDTYRYYLPRNQALIRATKDDLVLAAMDMSTLSSSGGFASFYDLNNKVHFARPPFNRPLSSNKIVVRPPGSTQEVAACFLEIYRKTALPLFREKALAAGKALYCSQGKHGGWRKRPAVDPACLVGVSRRPEAMDIKGTMDDGTQTTAIHFLMDLRRFACLESGCKSSWLDRVIANGLNFLVESQTEAGGWQQEYPEAKGYHRFITLNDGVTSDAISTLLHAYDEIDDKRLLQAAVKGGEFLLQVQGISPQSAWAQQYDESHQPAQARLFEPAGYASRETAMAMNALLDLYLATGQDRFLSSVRKAAIWLQNAQIKTGIWARLYEVGSGRPLYADRSGGVHYSLNELPESERGRYDWQGGTEVFHDIGLAFKRLDALDVGGKDALRKFDIERKQGRLLPGHTTAEVRPNDVPVEQAYSGAIDWGYQTEEGMVSSRLFVQYCATMLAGREQGR